MTHHNIVLFVALPLSRKHIWIPFTSVTKSLVLVHIILLSESKSQPSAPLGSRLIVSLNSRPKLQSQFSKIPRRVILKSESDQDFDFVRNETKMVF